MQLKMLLQLEAFLVLALSFAAVHVDAGPIRNTIKCTTSKYSASYTHCGQAVNLIMTRADRELGCLNNSWKSHCTILMGSGDCDIALCGSLGDPGCDVVASVAQAIVLQCYKGQSIGGLADISGLAGPNHARLGPQTVVIINNKNTMMAFGTRHLMAGNAMGSFGRHLLARGDEYQVPNTGYSFVVQSERDYEEALLPSEENALETAFIRSYRRGGGGHTMDANVRSEVPGGDGSARVDLYLSRGRIVRDFDESEVQNIIQSLNRFRDRQNNPGWFCVSLMSAGVGVVGAFNFFVSQGS